MAKKPEPVPWTHYVQLILTIILVSGFIAGILYIVRSISQAVQKTKDDLKAKGYNITKDGIDIKSDRRFSREDYLDASQRGFVKSIEAMSKAGRFRNPAAEEKQAQEAVRLLQKEKEREEKGSWRQRAKGVFT